MVGIDGSCSGRGMGMLVQDVTVKVVDVMAAAATPTIIHRGSRGDGNTGDGELGLL